MVEQFRRHRSLTLGGSPVPAFSTTPGTWVGLASSGGVDKWLALPLKTKQSQTTSSDNSDKALRDVEVLTPIRATWR